MNANHCVVVVDEFVSCLKSAESIHLFISCLFCFLVCEIPGRFQGDSWEIPLSALSNGMLMSLTDEIMGIDQK